MYTRRMDFVPYLSQWFGAAWFESAAVAASDGRAGRSTGLDCNNHALAIHLPGLARERQPITGDEPAPTSSTNRTFAAGATVPARLLLDLRPGAGQALGPLTALPSANVTVAVLGSSVSLNIQIGGRGDPIPRAPRGILLRLSHRHRTLSSTDYGALLGLPDSLWLGRRGVLHDYPLLSGSILNPFNRGSYWCR